MKKCFLSIVVIVVSLQMIVMATNIDWVDKKIIKINSNDIKFNNDIYMIDEKMYVSIRELSEKLRIPIEWNEERNIAELSPALKNIKVSESTKLKEEGVIPDEETAYKVGKIILEAYIGRSLEYETDKGVYYLKVNYHPIDNSWRVSQECKYKIGGGGGTGIYSPTVVMNKNTGEVTYISTYSGFRE